MIANPTVPRIHIGRLSAVSLALSLMAAHPLQLEAQTAAAPSGPPEAEREVIRLDPFEVTSDKGTRGYGTTNALGGTRINAPLADTPQSVVSLNQEFIKDVNPTNFADVLRFVSGITKAEGEYTGIVSIRGIQTSAIGFRDAIPDDITAPHGGTLPDPIEVERLEVIKGPAGVLYGSHGFGGVINRVSKRPLEQRRVEVGAEYTHYSNSEGFYRASLDATGPIDMAKKWRYRLLAAYQDGENHMHGGYKKQTLIGELQHRPDPNTTLWFRGRYSDDGIFVAQDLWTDVANAMPFGFMPRNAWVGNFHEDDQVDSTLARSLEAGASRSFGLFGGDWHARLLARSNAAVAQRRTYIALGGLFYRNGAPLVVGSRTLTTRNATWQEARAAGFDDIRENIARRDVRNGDDESWSINFDVTGTMDLGVTSHRILVYGGVSAAESFQRRFRENWVAARPSIFRKTSLPPSQVLDGNPQTLANEWTTTETWRRNFAIQDNVSLLEGRLILVGAYRYDTGTTDVFDHRANLDLPNEESSHWTPTYGVVAKPRAGVSLFYNHSETFQPQGGVTQSGDRLRPLIGENDELGMKLDLLDNRVVVTGSYFDMKQENSFIKVIFPDGSFDFQQVPSSVTKGWEVDLAAQPLENLTLLIAYQWIDAKTQNGLAVRNVPQGGSMKGVVRYALGRSVLGGRLELGVSHERINDSRSGDTNNSFFLPGYNLWGAFAIYKRADWRLQVNMENITDEWYVAGSSANLFMRSGPPLHTKFSLSRVF